MNECNLCRNITENFMKDHVTLPRKRQLFETMIDLESTVMTEQCEEQRVCLPLMRIKRELRTRQEISNAS